MADDETTPAPLSDAEIAVVAHLAGIASQARGEVTFEPGAPILLMDAWSNVRRLLATLAARHARLAAQNALINEAAQALEEAVQIRAERDAMREIVAAVAGDHVHQWDAVDPQEVWACEVCGEYSHDWAEEVQQRARALLGTSTPEGEDS